MPLPYLSPLLLGLILFVNLSRHNYLVDSQPYDSIPKSMFLQFTGADTFRNQQAHHLLLWLPLVYIEAYRGYAYTLLTVWGAFVTFGATLFYRTAPGYVHYHYCCSSYALWFVDGVAFANVLLHLTRYAPRRRALLLQCAAVLVWCTAFAVLCAVEAVRFSIPVALHHAFPFLMAGMMMILLELCMAEQEFMR